MKWTKKSHRILFLTLLISTIIILGQAGIRQYESSSNDDEAHVLEKGMLHTPDGKEMPINLPYKCSPVKPGSKIMVSLVLDARRNDSLYIRTYRSPVRVYQNGFLVFDSKYSLGSPNFLGGYVPDSFILTLPDRDSRSEITLEYSIPKNQQTLDIAEPISGTLRSLAGKILKRYGLSLIIALLAFGIGLICAIISLFIRATGQRRMKIVDWLALFYMSAGLWYIGINPASTLLLGNAELINAAKFLGLIYFLPSEVALVSLICGLEDDRQFEFFRRTLFILAAGMAVLRILPIEPSLDTMTAYHIVSIATYLFLFWKAMEAWVNRDNKWAWFLLIPLSLIIMLALLDRYTYFLDYRHHVMIQDQLAFLVLMQTLGFIAVMKIQDMDKEMKRVAMDERILAIQAEQQRRNDELIRRSEQELKRQRHDMRHQLKVIESYVHPENVQLLKYISELNGTVPSTPTFHCAEPGVNAIVSYFQQKYENEGISFECDIEVPDDSIMLSSFEFANIFANLLENGYEACMRQKDGKRRYVTLHSDMRGKLLTITMRNSCDPSTIRQTGKDYLSSKPNGESIGLDSIRSIAQAHEGDAVFKQDGEDFISLVYFIT